MSVEGTEEPIVVEVVEETEEEPLPVLPVLPVETEKDKLIRREADNTVRLGLALAAQRSLSLDETNDLSELVRWGKVLAASGMFNDVRGPAQAIVKVLYGRELGFTPMQSLTAIYFFSGKLVLSANGMAALIKKSSKYDYRVMHLDNAYCELAFYELVWEDGKQEIRELGRSIFTMNDAILAGIVKGTNWKNYPRNMLFSRAMSNGVKWFCADLLAGGGYIAGEIQGDGTPYDAEFVSDPLA